MERLLILHILLCVFVTSYAQMYTSTATEQPRRIGYTTNYGYSFKQSSYTVTPYHVNSTSFRSVNNHTYSTFRYTSTYMPVGTYRTSTPCYGNTPGSGPRKSAQRPFSGNFLEDLVDWWRMNTDSDWPGYVDPDYWDEFLADYPEYEDEARQWYEEQGIHFPGDPDDPFMEPLEDDLLLLSVFALIYCLLYYRKRKTASI